MTKFETPTCLLHGPMRLVHAQHLCDVCGSVDEIAEPTESASSMLPSASLDAIKKRFQEHYSRGIGEPIGLPRATWMEDTAILIAEIERLNAIATSASLEQQIEALPRAIWDRDKISSLFEPEGREELVRLSDVLALLRHADPQDQP